MNSCATCRFVALHREHIGSRGNPTGPIDTDDFLVCRRYPRTIVGASVPLYAEYLREERGELCVTSSELVDASIRCSEFPSVQFDDWCGEWKQAAGVRSIFEELDLYGVRAMRAIRVLGVKSIDELCAKHEMEILAIPGIGQTTVNEIRSSLAAIGRRLAGDRS